MCEEEKENFCIATEFAWSIVNMRTHKKRIAICITTPVKKKVAIPSLRKAFEGYKPKNQYYFWCFVWHGGIVDCWNIMFLIDSGKSESGCETVLCLVKWWKRKLCLIMGKHGKKERHVPRRGFIRPKPKVAIIWYNKIIRRVADSLVFCNWGDSF